MTRDFDCGLAWSEVKLTYTMEPSLWETNSRPLTQEIPNILWNPKVHYSVHKSPNPVHSPANLFLQDPF
jgi:hypothetical protein